MQEANQIMEKTMCGVCKHRHNLKEPHIWDDVPEEKPKRKVQKAAKPPDSISEEVAVNAVLKVAFEKSKEAGGPEPICQICGDKAHNDYLFTEKEKGKLRKRKERESKK